MRLPAEWHPQRAVLLAWPHEGTDWRPWLEAVEEVYTNIVSTISQRQNVLLVVADPALERRAREALQGARADLARIRFFALPTDDTWVRDYGPLTVLQDGRPVLLDWVFNGWGNKFPAKRDNGVTRRLHRAGAFGSAVLQRVDRVLEGGSIEVDGAGTLLTTASCLLSPRRNPGLDRDDYERTFARWFGIQRVLWLHHGHLAGDDTDGHIDTLARFCASHTITYTACSDANDEHYLELKAMEKELATFQDFCGNPYRLVPLPLPSAKFNADGQRLPATYANFLIINGAVLVPTYDDPADNLALSRLQTCFSDREVIGIRCRPLIEQYGSLHCLTMQIPAEEP